MRKKKKQHYAKYPNGSTVEVTGNIDGYYDGEKVIVVDNQKTKNVPNANKGNSYFILVQGVHYDEPSYIRTDYLK